MNFNTLVTKLNKRVELGFINTQFHKDFPSLQLYNYSDKCTFEEAWDEYTSMARGLIVCHEEKRIVARPFPKFHNYGTKHAYVPWEGEPFEVFEKMDGSLIIIFFYKGEWRTATRGSFSSDQAIWAKNWIDKNKPWPIKETVIFDTLTFLAEAIYPENRIVINYGDRSELVLLGLIDIESGEELNRVSALRNNWSIPKKHTPESFSKLLEETKALPGNQEGYVVRYASGNRIKIKGDEYCRIHRLISRVTPLALWENLAECENMEAIKKDIPDEFLEDFDKIVELLSFKFCENLKLVMDTDLKFKHLSDKELGLDLGQITNPIARKFIFSFRKGKFIKELYEKGSSTRKSFFDFIRPTGNRLVGYSSKSSMTRILEE